MKKSCLILLFVLMSLSAFYYYKLSGTPLGDKYWIPPLLALSVTFFLGNIHGIFFALRQSRISKKPESQWRDGDLIGISGRIQAIREPVEAPFSKRKAVIAEYDLKYTYRRGKSSTTDTVINGMLMAPCNLNTGRRTVRLVGFPLLASVGSDTLTDQSNYENAARYLLTTKFETTPDNPLKIMKILSDLLADDDGDLKADFKRNRDYFGLPESPGEPTDEEVSDLTALLLSSSYFLEETVIEDGEQITVFGTYRAAKQAVDVGSGIQNLNHQIHRGKVEDVVRRTLTKSIIFSIIFGAITYFSHIYVAKQAGLLPG